MIQSTERLVELIHSKHQVLVQLRDLVQRQTDLVASGDTSSLLRLLAAKQKLIAALQGLERELGPRYAEDPDRRVWVSREQRNRCAKQAVECNELLREIVILERSSAERMTARRDEVAQQLEQVHAAAHIRKVYEVQRRNHA